MTDAKLDDQYEIDSKVPNMAEVMADYAARSAEAAARPGAELDVAYGPDERHRLDVFPAAGSDRPALLFYHGGYWTGGSKEARRFPAAAWNAQGVTWVTVEYRLTPAVGIGDIVDDVRRSVAWFHSNAARFGCDPDALHVAGNSAGGHIAAMLAASGWQAPLGLPADVVKSATAVSGLFDLAPLARTFVDAWLRLDEKAVRDNSPIHFPPRAGLPVVVSWGARESREFRRQSEEYSAMCAATGADVAVFDRPDHDHFSIIGELADPESPLFAAIAEHVVAGGS